MKGVYFIFTEKILSIILLVMVINTGRWCLQMAIIAGVIGIVVISVVVVVAAVVAVTAGVKDSLKDE